MLDHHNGAIFSVEVSRGRPPTLLVNAKQDALLMSGDQFGEDVGFES